MLQKLYNPDWTKTVEMNAFRATRVQRSSAYGTCFHLKHVFLSRGIVAS